MPKLFVSKEWDRGLEHSRILPLLYIPHFCHNIPIKTCVKQLLVFFHGGFLCLGNPIPIDIELIAIITCLPFIGMDPTPLLRMYQEVSISTQMKKKYDIVRENIVYMISSINYYTIHLVAKVFSSNLMQKIHRT